MRYAILIFMLGKFIPHLPVFIYGAGFAGLSLAYQLKKLNIPFTLYEKQKVGGKISSIQSQWGPMEAAASTLYMNAEAEKFISELKLPFLVSEKKLKRWIWQQQGLTAPFSLRLLSRLLIHAPGKFPHISDHSTVEDIFFPLLGRKYIDDLLSSALQGIYAAEARDLHFLSIFPFARNKAFSSYFSFFKALRAELKLNAAHNIKGSISFKNGMQTLIDRLYAEVKDHIKPVPDNFILQPNTVICTPAPEASSLLKSVLPEIATQLNQINYRPMTSLSLMLNQELTELKQSFGILIPQKFSSNILGIIHQSGIFPANYKAHCYSIICKGTLSEEQVLKELSSKLSSFERGNILTSSIHSWTTGLPLYDKKRFEAVNNIDEILRNKPGVILFGNYTSGISLRSMIEQTRSLKLE